MPRHRVATAGGSGATAAARGGALSRRGGESRNLQDSGELPQTDRRARCGDNRAATPSRIRSRRGGAVGELEHLAVRQRRDLAEFLKEHPLPVPGRVTRDALFSGTVHFAQVTFHTSGGDKVAG